VVLLLRLFFTPVWFNGWDIIFELISLLVALLIAAYSWKLYNINKDNKFAYFSFAFVLVALGFFFKMATSGILYFTPIRDAAAGVLRPVAGQSLEYSGILYRLGFFLQMVPMLGAWLLIFFISQRSRARLRKFYEVSQIALFIYLILLISFVSNFKYFVFYLTSSVILALIVLNYYKNYLNTQKRTAYLVLLSFLFILLGNLFSIFVFMFKDIYVIGEGFILLGFLLLLYTYRKVIRK
jgi:hypothetical protein